MVLITAQLGVARPDWGQRKVRNIVGISGEALTVFLEKSNLFFFYGIWNIFILIMEALLHKQCVLLPTSVIDVSDGHDHFLILVSIVSRVKSSLSSRNGLPRPQKASTRASTSFLNVSLELWDGSWWEVKEWMEWHSNSWIIRDISGPATIHLLNAAGFPLSPTASPSTLSRALNCSCSWSSAMPRKALFVLCTTNLSVIMHIWAIHIPELDSQTTCIVHMVYGKYPRYGLSDRLYVVFEVPWVDCLQTVDYT